MKWETPLDRLVLKEIDLAGSESRKSSVQDLLVSLLRLNATRPQSYFALGYAQGLHGLELEAYRQEDLEEEAASWHRFGSTMAQLLQPQKKSAKSSSSEGDDEEDSGEESSDSPQQPDLTPLLDDPTIAAELLPFLLRQTLAAGNLEESVKILEDVLRAGVPDDETAEMLRSTLAEILRRAERPRERLDTEQVLGLLQRCMGLPGFDELPPEIVAPFHRAQGKLKQHVENFDEAADHFRTALEVAGEGHTLASVLHFDLAACLLGIRGVPDLEPKSDRGDVDDAVKHLDLATADVKRASFNAFFARGVLNYEKEAFEDAVNDFRAALERIEQYRNPLPVTLARIRYFLAQSLLQIGDPEDRDEAVKLLERSLDRIKPDLKTFDSLFELLAEKNAKTASRILNRLDLANSSNPEEVLAAGRYYQKLGDGENALKVAESALEKLENVELRREALLLELRCFNMLGERENARDALFDLRDLAYQSEALDFLEEVLFDDDLVGQALDRGRLLTERAELLARVSGRDDERYDLLRESARRYLDRAEPHWKVTGLRMLRDAHRRHAGVFDADLRDAEEIAGDLDTTYDRGAADEARNVLSRTPHILVIGGDEHQDRREDDLEAVAGEWGLDAEWWETDYVNPDRVTDRLKDYLTTRQPDGVLLLHWNRNEVVREVRKQCRSYRVPTRFAHYAGVDSIRQGCGELLAATASQFSEEDDEGNAARA